ncbi:MAG: threonylcarbamoyl-AMP synthase [Bacteroidia bacterium]|nr:threonylcarbamoyl-AMP synthase [Bacteroidia bacterium]
MIERGTDIQKAAELLRGGACVAIPTETVYGLAAHAFDTEAVASVFRIKERPSFDPLILHIASQEQLAALVTDFPEKARILAGAFWPGPLTLVLPKSSTVPYNVTSGLETVGIRIPDHPLTLQLLWELNFPLAAPSANPFGYVSPTTAQHVVDSLGEKVPYVLDGGPCTRGIESTIVGFEDGEPVIYRLGSLPVQEIEKQVGKVRISVNQSSNPVAPGQVKMHYAPLVPLLNLPLEEALKTYRPEELAVLVFGESPEAVPSQNRVFLSAKGDLYEAARNLFGALRQLDTLPVKAALFSYVNNEGIGAAINDRLRRAAARHS